MSLLIKKFTLVLKIYESKAYLILRRLGLSLFSWLTIKSFLIQSQCSQFKGKKQDGLYLPVYISVL